MWNRISQVVVLLVLVACIEETEPQGVPTGIQMIYPIYTEDIQVWGQLTMRELDDNSIDIVVQLNAPVSGSVEVALYSDNAVDGDNEQGTFGTIAAGTSGGTYLRPSGVAMNFAGFIAFDGHIAFFDASNERIGFADIGSNVWMPENEAYEIFEVSQTGVQGNATFQRRKNDETLVIIQMQNTVPGDLHPAHIHNNTVNIGGGVVVSLAPVNGDNGLSLTNVTRQENNAVLTYEDLVSYDGYIAVHRSFSQFGIFSGLGDIGKNAFTGNEATYESRSVSGENAFGTVTLQERRSGNTLLTIELNNTVAGVSHVTHIHENTAAEGGSIIIGLGNIDGNTGLATFEVSENDNEDPVTYSDLMAMHAFINVHYSAQEFGKFISQADIGQSGLTGDKVEYDILEKDGSGVSGKISFEKRYSTETLVTVKLNGLDPAREYLNHIHEGSIADSKSPIINLSMVAGSKGWASTHVTQLSAVGNTEVSYDELIQIDGHYVIHDPDNTAIFLAWCDVGGNAN